MIAGTMHEIHSVTHGRHALTVVYLSLTFITDHLNSVKVLKP